MCQENTVLVVLCSGCHPWECYVNKKAWYGAVLYRTSQGLAQISLHTALIVHFHNKGGTKRSQARQKLIIIISFIHLYARLLFLCTLLEEHFDLQATALDW